MTRQHKYLDGPWHDVQEKCPSRVGGCLISSGAESPIFGDFYRDKPAEEIVKPWTSYMGQLRKLTERVDAATKSWATEREQVDSLTERVEKLEEAKQDDRQYAAQHLERAAALLMDAALKLDPPDGSSGEFRPIGERPAPPVEAALDAAKRLERVEAMLVSWKRAYPDHVVYDHIVNVRLAISDLEDALRGGGREEK